MEHTRWQHDSAECPPAEGSQPKGSHPDFAPLRDEQDSSTTSSSVELDCSTPMTSDAPFRDLSPEVHRWYSHPPSLTFAGPTSGHFTPHSHASPAPTSSPGLDNTHPPCNSEVSWFQDDCSLTHARLQPSPTTLASSLFGKLETHAALQHQQQHAASPTTLRTPAFSELSSPSWSECSSYDARSGPHAEESEDAATPPPPTSPEPAYAWCQWGNGQDVRDERTSMVLDTALTPPPASARRRLDFSAAAAAAVEETHPWTRSKFSQA